jgi:hypothetical protein
VNAVVDAFVMAVEGIVVVVFAVIMGIVATTVVVAGVLVDTIFVPFVEVLMIRVVLLVVTEFGLKNATNIAAMVVIMRQMASGVKTARMIVC